MAEIDRVNLSIDAHFKVYGDPRKHPKEMGELAHTLVKCVCASTARAVAQARENKTEVPEKVREMIEQAEGAARVLQSATEDSTMTAKIEDILTQHGWSKADAADAAKNPFQGQTCDKVLTADNFKKAAELAMVARRALYPLDGENPWDEPRDPKEALYDDDDIHSWSIFDTFVEPIQELLPPLFRLSTEGWDSEDE